MSAARDRASLAAAACEGMGRTLELDGVWMVCRRRGRVGAESEWLRPHVRAQRLGGPRLAEIFDALDTGASVGTAGRQATVAVPVDVKGERAAALVGSVRGDQQASDETVEMARAFAVHLGACLEMLGDNGTAAEPARNGAEPRRGSTPAGRTERDLLDVLHALAASVAAARTEAAVGHAVLDQLRRLITFDAARFYLRSPDGKLLLPVAQRSMTAEYSGDSPEELIVGVGEGITGVAFAELAATRIDDANAVPHAVDIPGTDPIDESQLVAPMMAEGGPIGVIVLTRDGLARFTDEDLHVLEVVAAQAAVSCESVRLAGEQREAAEVAEALLELGAALSMQGSVEAIARMLTLAINRLIECAGVSVWLREGEEMRPAMLVGYTPQEQARLTSARIPVSAEPFASAVKTKRITLAPVDHTPLLAGCLDAAPAGSSFAIVAVGERAANRAAIVVQRGPRRGAPSYRDEQMLIGIADQALLAMTNRMLYDELETSFLSTVEALGNALDLKDQYTNDHAQALVGLCTRVAERLGMSATAVRDVSFAAALHDIGKIGIPLQILNKPGRLTDEEFELMKQHPELGARIIEPVPALAGARELVLACHEHWDGSGYPRRLQGEEIPEGARVILACDAFHAMTSDRVYRNAMSLPDAIAELRRCSGTQFDPQVIDSLVAVIAESEFETAA